MSIKEQIRAEIDARRQNMVYELYGLPEDGEKYIRVKGMHDAYVDMLTYIDYHLPEQPVEGLEEAAGAYLDNHKPLTRYNWGDLMDAFKAGAEWAMKQGVKTTGTISPRGIIYDTNVGYHLFLERYHNGDKVEIQIRKIKENGK